MLHRLAAAAAISCVLVLSSWDPGDASRSAAAADHAIHPLWVADAVCETGHNPPSWHDRAGVYEGGIRFYAGTWRAWRGYVAAARRFEHADQAPAWLQAAVAEQGLRRFGRWGCLYHANVWAHR